MLVPENGALLAKGRLDSHIMKPAGTGGTVPHPPKLDEKEGDTCRIRSHSTAKAVGEKVTPRSQVKIEKGKAVKIWMAAVKVVNVRPSWRVWPAWAETWKTPMR
jgi:hypothetical protein